MPRPCKRRRICAMPGCRQFGPYPNQHGDEPPVTLALDEFESIRLIDMEGLTQEQAASRMGVARATAQAIYAQARHKLAQFLTTQATLVIEGGDYELCEGEASGCPISCGRRMHNRTQDGRNNTMKIAVTYDNGTIFQHFGHTAQFKVYETDGKSVLSSEIVDTNGSGHGELAGLLSVIGADILICGGIGGGAQMALANAGIKLYAGVAGDPDAAVEALLKGELPQNAAANCNHHHHDHDHACGEHGCGEHHGGHECGHGDGGCHCH